MHMKIVMPLQLQHLETLLALPCVINEDICLTSTPIIQQARVVSDFVYNIDVLSGEDITSFLKRIYKGRTKFDMDCSIYAQLCSLVLTGRWPKFGGFIVFYIFKGSGAYCMSRSMIPEMGYLQLQDSGASEMLSRMTTSSKGQWLIKIANSNYLGLSKLKPMLISLSDWATQLRSGLLNFARNCDDLLQRGFIDVLEKQGKLNNWVIYGRKERTIVQMYCGDFPIEESVVEVVEIDKVSLSSIKNKQHVDPEEVVSGLFIFGTRQFSNPHRDSKMTIAPDNKEFKSVSKPRSVRNYLKYYKQSSIENKFSCIPKKMYNFRNSKSLKQPRKH